jgi:hypothetical protein
MGVRQLQKNGNPKPPKTRKWIPGRIGKTGNTPGRVSGL